MKTTVHIISHSHWDREWYMPFEKHRMKLLELMDTAMELFETDEEFHGFHLDGQTIVLDDYLEIKPQNRAKLEKYIQDGKFTAGPWYVLQDEFFERRVEYPESDDRNGGCCKIRKSLQNRIFPGCVRKCRSDAADFEAGRDGSCCVWTWCEACWGG